MSAKLVGMYVHQHWSYNHPYAARTWTLENWKGYLDGLYRLGYNLVQIWPVLETIPNPMTPSDEENLAKIAEVIRIAHETYGMRVFIALCPNIVAYDDEARKFTFQERPFFRCDKRVDPGDPQALAGMLAWREQLFRPLAQVDGVSIIDSDPGCYPGSRNHEFVYLMAAHRRMLNRLRPGIALVYWNHSGWEAYARFYETGEYADGPDEESQDAVRQLAKTALEPWGILSARGKRIAEPVGQYERCIRFSYGAVEGEPSFPMTNFGTAQAERPYDAGTNADPRGTMANAQSHCLQLPNTLVFARAAQGRATSDPDYVAFCEELIPGKGAVIVSAWQALGGNDANAMRVAADSLAAVPESALQPGPLGGLLLGSPQRFMNDLVLQLRARASFVDFIGAVDAGREAVARTFPVFVDAIAAWQAQHGYKNQWYWPGLDDALRKLGSDAITQVLESRNYKAEGATPFERVQNGFKQVETLTPRLIDAMKAAAETM